MKAYIKPEALVVSLVESQALLTGSTEFDMNSGDTTGTIATKHKGYDDSEDWEDWDEE